jgi:hypothetical protein
VQPLFQENPAQAAFVRKDHSEEELESESKTKTKGALIINDLMQRTPCLSLPSFRGCKSLSILNKRGQHKAGAYSMAFSTSHSSTCPESPSQHQPRQRAQPTFILLQRPANSNVRDVKWVRDVNRWPHKKGKHHRDRHSSITTHQALLPSLLPISKSHHLYICLHLTLSPSSSTFTSIYIFSAISLTFTPSLSHLILSRSPHEHPPLLSSLEPFHVNLS